MGRAIGGLRKVASVAGDDEFGLGGVGAAQKLGVRGVGGRGGRVCGPRTARRYALARISHRAAADVGFSDVSGCLSGFWGREPGVLSLSGRG
jgi:hypothetical protein